MNAAARTRFLVVHDYGMGANWWWVTSIDGDEILETFADVEVVDDPALIESAAYWDLAEVDVTGPHPPGLDGLAAKRSAQRGRPGYGALARRAGPVHVRWDEPSSGATWFTEFTPGGRRIRQVRVDADGASQALTTWTIDVPQDLRDPAMAPLEISAAEFERAWSLTRPATPSGS